MTTRSNTSIDQVPEICYIYESPDGGKTVYARPFMSDERIIVATQNSDLMENAKRANRFLAIFRKANEDPTINDLLNQLEELYILKYGEHDKND